jgi:small subunit ribosomal protein S20
MPTTKSAKKRHRQSLEQRARNRAVKSVTKSTVRAVRDAVASNDIAKAESAFKLAAKTLDQSGAHRVIHPNKAARLKSRLQQLIRKKKQATAK